MIKSLKKNSHFRLLLLLPLRIPDLFKLEKPTTTYHSKMAKENAQLPSNINYLIYKRIKFTQLKCTVTTTYFS